MLSPPAFGQVQFVASKGYKTPFNTLNTAYSKATGTTDSLTIEPKGDRLALTNAASASPEQDIHLLGFAAGLFHQNDVFMRTIQVSTNHWDPSQLSAWWPSSKTPIS